MKVPFVLGGSEVDPCCCQNCADIFDVDLAVFLVAPTACPGGSITGMAGSFTAIHDGSGNWTVVVGSGTFTGGLSGDGTLLLSCDPTTGKLFIGISMDGSLSGFNAFSSGPASVPFDAPAANVNTCGGFELGSGGTVTVTFP